MPIYEYECRDCGHEFELIRPMSDADKVVECTTCKSNNTHRQLSLFNAGSGGRAIAGSSSGCSNCSGGHCSSCNH